jgi:hypothetical protein
MRRRISRKFRRKIGADSTESEKALTYHENDLVAIKRTQPGLKLALVETRNKYLGPYKIVKILRDNQYVVRKIDDHVNIQWCRWCKTMGEKDR